MNRTAFLIPGVFVLIGAVPLFSAVVWTWTDWNRTQQMANWPEGQAVIESCYHTRNAQTGEVYYDYRGQWTDASGVSRPLMGHSVSCTVGERYPLRYDPDHPDDLPAQGGFLPLPQAILAFLGIAFVGIGGKNLIAMLREAAKSPPQGDKRP